MSKKSLTIGFAITGSFCTINAIPRVLENLIDHGMNIIPIISENCATIDTRYGKSSDLIEKLRQLTSNEPIKDIAAAEKIGPKSILDALIIAPCTGNTLAKLACSITDSCVSMAAKAQLRNEKPVIISISTNDGLKGNAKNIGQLLNSKNIYFVPFKQDNPIKKPASLVADIDLIYLTTQLALKGKQLQPIIT